jgi:nitroreductase
MEATLQHARQPEHPVDTLFLNRRSPRAFRARSVSREHLMSMVEAARWAPSSFNLQPWKFHVTDHPGPLRSQWNKAIMDGNRWSDAAPVLTWVTTRKTMGPNPWMPAEAPNPHARFDAGMASLQFILQGERLGLSSHVMGGIRAEEAHAMLGLSEDEEVVCAIVTGYAVDPAELDERTRARETPSGRKPTNQVASIQ